MINYISNLAISLLNSILYIFAANLFPTESFGYLSVAKSYFALIVFFGDLNLMEIHVKKMAEATRNRNSYFSLYVLLKVMLLPMVGLFFFFLINAQIRSGLITNQPEQIRILWMMGISGLLSSFSFIYTGSFQAEMKVAKMQIPLLSGQIIRSIISVFAIFVYQNFQLYVFANLVCYLIIVLANLLLGRHFKFTGFKRDLLKQYLIFGLPILIPRVMNIFVMNLGPILFLRHHGEDLLGIYQVLANLILILTLIDSSAKQILIPAITPLCLQSESFSSLKSPQHSLPKTPLKSPPNILPNPSPDSSPTSSQNPSPSLSPNPSGGSPPTTAHPNHIASEPNPPRHFRKSPSKASSQLSEIIRRYEKYMLLISAVMLLAYSIAGQELLYFLLGAEFATNGFWFVYMSLIFTLSWSLWIPYGVMLFIREKTWITVLTESIKLGLSVICWLWFIPTLDIMALNLGLWMALIPNTLICRIFAYRTYRIGKLRRRTVGMLGFLTVNLMVNTILEFRIASPIWVEVIWFVLNFGIFFGFAYGIGFLTRHDVHFFATNVNPKHLLQYIRGEFA